MQIMFYGKNKNEGKTQMVQQLEVICAMIPVHICYYNPESGFQISKKQQQTIIKYTGNDIFCIYVKHGYCERKRGRLLKLPFKVTAFLSFIANEMN